MKREYTEKTERGPVFRGKDVKSEEWVFGYLARYGPVTGKAYHVIVPDYASVLYGIAVDPSSVGQGSGVNDKNGEEMFVGDIVHTAMLYGGTVPIIGRVGFADGAFGLWWPWAGAEAFHPFCTICNTTYEIIGNMTDTPEKYENR